MMSNFTHCKKELFVDNKAEGHNVERYNVKKNQIEVRGHKETQLLNVFGEIYQKRCFFWSCDFIFNFFCTFLKSAPEYIDPSGHFVF